MKEKKFNLEEIKQFAKNLRRKVLDMAYYAGANSSHFGGALSSAEIISYLYGYYMNFDKKNPLWEDRDRFILSKGHGCLSYYAALSEIGYIKNDDLKTFEKDNTDLLGHPVINKNKGIEFSNGSLGMGLSLGIGVALAGKKKNKKYRVFVVLGDGECNEGSVWEAAMSAPNFKLNNLTIIIDNNKFQQTGSNKEIMDTTNLKKKWESFGWDVFEINGHDLNEIDNFFSMTISSDKPKALIANTVKGKGFSFSENNNDWHHSILSKKFYDQGLEELNSK
tara:strand:- start:1095 stop:1928 length:834 start_codon:yes stop_codon:yes gene_type:complete